MARRPCNPARHFRQGEAVGGIRVAVVHEDELRLFLKSMQPAEKAVLVGVAAYAGQHTYRGAHLDILVEELDLLCPVYERPAGVPTA